MVFRLSGATGLKLKDGPQLPRVLVAASARDGRLAPTGLNLYVRFAFAGTAGFAIVHGAITPADVLKTRVWLEP
uniref:Mitochondrial phosphate carrier protein n=1 Tax=Tetraselmis sp. GSL018 TaxID=582737 RepID=A0A061S9R0_9CHLO